AVVFRGGGGWSADFFCGGGDVSVGGLVVFGAGGDERLSSVALGARDGSWSVVVVPVLSWDGGGCIRSMIGWCGGGCDGSEFEVLRGCGVRC
ncbi:hypothetical protein A2U01_0050501, partial [Trifolium medium]|nr:hypothetical protein [Trifolium medium]